MKKIFLIILSLIIAISAGICIYMKVSGIGPFDRTPAISLIGDEDINLTLGEHYVEPGFTASDYKGNDIRDKVKYDHIDPRDAGEYTIKYSITDSDITVCVTRTITISYAKPDPGSKDFGHGIPVLMYHNVYDPQNPPAKIDSNFITTDSLREQLEYLVQNDYYFPTWKEIRDYIDGKIDLPVKSVVLTFDDCTRQFIDNGIPLLEEYDVRATSFVICKKNGKEMAKKNLKHVAFQSHSYDMHKAGGNIGHGGIFTALSHDKALEDLNQSIEILGSSDAFAYPYGDYTIETRQVVEDAGFLVAFTTENNKVYPGDDPLLLSRVRVEGYISLDEYISIL